MESPTATNTVRSSADSAKKPSAAKRRNRTVFAHKALRYCIQIAFFILAPALFSGAFSGIKYIFTSIGAIRSIEATSFVMLLVAVLAFTIVFGRFFCGYACAFGTLGDVLYGIFEFLRSKTPIPRIRFPEKLVKVLSLLKYAVLAGICVACVMGVWSVVSGYSPWEAFASIIAGSFDVLNPMGVGILAAIMVGMIVRERFFCQFLCPLGAVFSLMPVLGFSEFSRTRDHCAHNCGRCHEACPVDIWPDTGTLGHGECISCGRCADVCPMNNVNMVAIEKRAVKEERLAAEAARARKAAGTESTSEGKLQLEQKPAAAPTRPRPLRKSKATWHLLRGSGAWYVLVKAVLLLAICWALGATRYIPSFSAVMAALGLT